MKNRYPLPWKIDFFESDRGWLYVVDARHEPITDFPYTEKGQKQANEFIETNKEKTA